MRVLTASFALLASLCASLPGIAAAQAPSSAAPPPPPPLTAAPATGASSENAPAAASAASDEPRRRVSVTISPIHLASPIVELTGELRLHDKIGVALIGGYGSVRTKTVLQEYRFRAYELGAHFNYYVLGSFDHGMQIGAEALYAHVSTDGQVEVRGAANGLAIGPYVGYKLITNIGFTFEANAGAQYVGMTAKASDGARVQTGSDSRVIALVNLNIGWSF